MSRVAFVAVVACLAGCDPLDGLWVGDLRGWVSCNDATGWTLNAVESWNIDHSDEGLTVVRAGCAPLLAAPDGADFLGIGGCPSFDIGGQVLAVEVTRLFVSEAQGGLYGQRRIRSDDGTRVCAVVQDGTLTRQ